MKRHNTAIEQQGKQFPIKKCKPTTDDSVPKNCYKGFCLTSNHYRVERIDLTEDGITREIFYERYVRQRKPVILTKSLHQLDPNCKIRTKRWTDEFLNKVAGNSRVQVEYRSSLNAGFGKGVKKNMTFAEFLNSKHNSKHYLTTQNRLDDRDRPYIMSSPCKELFEHGEFSLIPQFLCSLIPFNINMWMGHSKEGKLSWL